MSSVRKRQTKPPTSLEGSDELKQLEETSSKKWMSFNIQYTFIRIRIGEQLDR